MKRTILIISLASVVCLVIASACGKGRRAPDDTYPVRTEMINGVRTVINPAFPKEGVIRYALQDELTIGGEEGADEAVLNRPVDLKVDPQGNIFVLDWGDVQFKVFAPDGRLLRTFGKEGQGPGEFAVPAYFELAADGRIFLLSARQHQMISLDGEGKYLSSFRLDGFCHKLGVDRHDRIYYSQLLMPEEGVGEEFRLVRNRMVLFRTDALGKETASLGEYPDVTMLRKIMKVGAGMTSSSQTSRESYTTVWLVGPDDRVYIGYSKDYRLDVRDADWTLLFRFGRDFTPLRHPAYKPDGPHPEFYPAFSDWRKFFDGEGNLWLEQYVEEGVKDHVFDVFSPDGIYLRQVRVPEALYLVRDDKAYSIIRQEDEFLVVKRFKLEPVLAKD
jgi:hypothetical protein